MKLALCALAVLALPTLARAQLVQSRDPATNYQAGSSATTSGRFYPSDTKSFVPAMQLVDANGIVLCTDAAGALCAPKAGTANRVITKTSLAANTNTTICPTATNPVTTEIFFTVAGVGVSLNGGTLTTATPGTTANTTPDWATTAANGYYLFPVAPTNAITAYGAAGLVVCVQTVRQ